MWRTHRVQGIRQALNAEKLENTTKSSTKNEDDKNIEHNKEQLTEMTLESGNAAAVQNERNDATLPCTLQTSSDTTYCCLHVLRIKALLLPIGIQHIHCPR